MKTISCLLALLVAFVCYFTHYERAEALSLPIYLSHELLEQGNADKTLAVLIEELGHSIDWQNSAVADGDKRAILADAVLGNPLTTDQPSITKPGLGEKDVLTSGVGADRFLLGTSAWMADADGNVTTAGLEDYALITDFNPAEDKIQLQGATSNYRPAPSPIANITGTAIFIDKPGTEPDELIAIVQNVPTLNLTSNAFAFIEPNALLNPPKLTLNNSAKFTTGVDGISSVLRLTDNFYQSGSAFLTNAVNLSNNASFSTFFKFQITDSKGLGDSDGRGADGLMFVVQTVANNVGSVGGGLGYEGIQQSLGIEFDTFQNPGDINGNHVGVDLNGSVTSVIAAPVTNRLNNSNVWDAWVDYNGLTKTLEVRIAETDQRPTTAFLSYTIDLPSVLGKTDAFIGFTSGTAAGAGTHDILDWQFNGAYSPISAGTLAFSAPQFSVREDGKAIAAITVNRTNGSYGQVSAMVNLTDGTATSPSDYNNAPITVTFVNGETSKIVTIPIVNDGIPERDETVLLSLINPTGGAIIGQQNSATLTILDNKPGTLAFSAPQFSVREDGTPIAAVTVTRSGGLDGPVSATIGLRDGTAKATSDYNNAPIAVNFADGETSKIVTISIVKDTIAEPDETLQLSLTNPTGGATIGQQNSATLTILDQAGPLITAFPQGTSGSNKGQTTIVLAGQNFSPTDQISLIAPNGTAKAASNVYWVNETEAWATFDLQGLTTGKYNVSLKNGGNSFVANNAFTVTDGARGNVQTKLSYPARGFVSVTYINVGQPDAGAPLFRIAATNAQVTQPARAGVSATLARLLNLDFGSGSDGAGGILAPGESGQFNFAYTPAGNGVVSFAVEQVSPNEVIDWATIKAEARANYSFIDAGAWDAIWSNLTTSLGQTVVQFQAVMADNANRLSQLGQPTSDLARLFAFEWKQAAHTLTNVSLLSTTDVVDAAPGLSLTFGRTFYQSTAERYNEGSLGRGWASQWDLRATTDPTGNVVIRSVGDLQRVFEKQTDGTYREAGAGATLTLTKGQYRLREANGQVSLFANDGKLSSVEDTNGNRITLQYTSNRLTKLVHTNGDSLTLGYNPQGRISQITDTAGQVTTYRYDAAAEHLLSVTTVAGTTTHTYDTDNVAATKHDLLSVASDQGYQRTFEYDNQGRLAKKYSNGQAQSLTYSYDSAGGITTTDGAGAVRTVLLDDRGNVGQFRDVRNQNSLYRYDANGNLIGATLPNGGQSGYRYDNTGNLTQQTNLLSQDIKFTYDPTFNRLAGFTDAKGNGVSYTYDTKGNNSKIAYADGTVQQLNVDPAGNIISTVNRRGSEIAYTYNKDGQLATKQIVGGSNTAYGYDPKGNITSVTDATGTIAIEYDAANRLKKITYPTGRSLQYDYNAAGQRTHMVTQDGYTTNYSYDTVGRLKSLTDGAGQMIITYDYDAASRLTKETNGNGTYTTYEYDSQNQLTRLINYKADNTVNSRFEYAYDTVGRRTSMTTLEGTFQYGYDATGQLTSVVTPDKRILQYQYDAAGNRIGVTDNGATTNYTSNNLNQYTNVGNAVYSYDKDGNLISKTQAGQTSTYTYDVENRLTKVVTPAGTWEYQYDALGNRIASILNGQRTDYLIDPFGLGNVIGEFDGSGNLVARYNHGIGLVNRVDGRNGAYYYDADALGSTVGLTGANGSYVNRYSYLPFGEDLTQKVETVANPFEYVGQWGVMDEANGLDFMRARFYDSNLGRFTAADPIGLNGGDTNFYRYVFNSPTVAIDPQGTFLFLPVGILVNSAGFSAGLTAGLSDQLGFPTSPDSRIARRTAKLLPLYDYGYDIAPDVLEILKREFDPDGTNGNKENDPESGGKDPAGTGPGGKTPDGKTPGDKPPGNKPKGSTNGDPHLTTIDGISYDFQAVGEFTLLKSTTDDLEIQTRQQPWGNSTAVSVNSAIAIKIDGQRLGFYLNDASPLKINGTATPIADGTLYAIGQALISRSGNRYTIFFANGDQLQFTLNGSFIDVGLGLADNRKGKVVGLLGNGNDNRSDDFALRDGILIGSTITNQQLYGTYANSWRITQPTALFNYTTGQTTTSFTDLTFPRNLITLDTLDPQVRARAEATARAAGITDPDLLKAAILDIALTNAAPEFLQGYVTLQRQATITGTNTLINPDGFGPDHWLATSTVIPYSLRFSNTSAIGTNPVAQITITQPLDPDLDLNTFTLSDFGFGNLTINVPLGLQSYSQRLDLRSTRGVFVDVIAGLNPTTGIVTWSFTAINPTTGNPVTNPTQGFLPPNDQTGAGQGFFGYSIQPKAGGTSGTRVDAQATITFNHNPPQQTAPTFNTLDSNLPTSSVIALPATSSTPAFTVTWAGSDTGSGLASYDILVATDGGPFVPWQTNTTATSALYNGQFGRTYAFYSIARDNAGNVEAPPTTPDAQITLSGGNPSTIAFSNVQFSIREDGTPITAVTLTRTGSSNGAVSATITLTNGTAIAPDDYTNTPIIVNFANGETSKTVAIPIVNDTLYETNETLNLTLSNLTGGAAIGTQSTATLTIIDNDPLAVANLLPDMLIIENAAFNFTIPSNTFNAAVSLNPTATLSNGNPLPTWLNFNATTRTFNGTPTKQSVGTLGVKVTVTAGDGSSASAIFDLTVTTPNKTPIVGNTDFNRDGQTDLVWRNYATGQNAIWLMNGTSLSQGLLINPLADLNWSIAGTGDFNRDGQTDLVWRNYATGQNAIWLMNGTNFSQEFYTTPLADLNWSVAGTGDFNRDGQSDLVWRNYATGQNAIWLMNGTTLIQGIHTTPVADLNWSIAGTGDFNRDGQSDLVWRNYATGQNAIWLMNGTDFSQGFYTTPVTDLDWKIASTGDFNQDGQTDLIWRNGSIGKNAVWLMNGTTLSQGIYLNTDVPDANWRIGNAYPGNPKVFPSRR